MTTKGRKEEEDEGMKFYFCDKLAMKMGMNERRRRQWSKRQRETGDEKGREIYWRIGK